MKRITKAVIAVVLTLLMIVGTMTVAFAEQSDISDTSAGTISVYFTNNQNWSNVYCYAWNSAQSSVAGEWPGTQMTFVEQNDYGQSVYKADISDATKGIVFNGGSGQAQTVDITTDIENNMQWWTVGLESGKYTVECSKYKEDEPEEPTTATKLSVNGTEYSFDGSMKATAPVNATGDNTVLVKKYTDGEVTTTYYLENAVAASDTSVSMTTTENENKFLTTETKLCFTFNESTSTLSWETSSTKTFYFQDNTGDNWISDLDADMYLSVDSGANFILMTESVDMNTGLKTWYATVETPSNGTTINFVRANRLFRYSDWGQLKSHSLSLSTDGTYVYNRFSGTYSDADTSASGVYRVSGDSGSWISGSVKCANGKENSYSYGIYVDTKGNGDTKDFVKFYTDSKTTTSSVPTSYKLFLPSYVDLQNAKVYTSFADCKISGGNLSNKEIAASQANTIDLSGATSYTVSYKQTSSGSSKSLTLKLYKTNSTSAMLLTTKEDLYTKTLGSLKSSGWASDYKEAIADKGSYKLYSESGEQVNSDTGLKKIKGRGNSSWEASMEVYGKYAYNMTTTEKAKLISGATASKKYCLMANNMDESGLRNTLVYAIAEEAGCLYVPKTRLLDLFDNGNYMGSYVLIEKVEYGKNTMMATATNGETVKSLDSYNEDTAVAAGIDYDSLEQAKSSVTVNGNSIEYKYNRYMQDGVDVYDQALTDYQNYDYVMEFELKERADNEASYFKTKDGQYICMKYPEFASKSEMKWFINEFIPVWDAVYASNYNGYKDALDVDSFAKTYIIQELTENLDSAATSYYITGGKNFDKFVAAPLWDYDWAVGDYYKTKLTTSNSVVMDNPQQMFVKYKSMNTNAGEVSQSTKCFEAALTNNSSFYDVCKDQWTNNFAPALSKYIDNGWTDGNTNGNYSNSKLLLTDLLSKFETAQAMNEARWHQMSDLNSGSGTMSWGTKCTSTYAAKSYTSGMNVGNARATGASSSYANTVYYLNDWLALRWNYMSSATGGALWDDTKKATISDVTFSATQGTGQNADKLTIDSINVSATLGGSAVANSNLTVVVKNNGKSVKTFALDKLSENKEITLAVGDNKITVEVYITSHNETKAVSSSKTYKVEEADPSVSINIYFKSSEASAYIPSVKAGDEEPVAMVMDTLLGPSYDHTQNFGWFKEVVDAKTGESLTLTFTNTAGMNATYTINSVEAIDYYLAVDNVASGTKVVNLTNSSEKTKNFFATTSHLVSNDIPTGSSNLVAYTNIGGTVAVLGDVNNDNVLSIVDAGMIQQSLAGVTTLNDKATKLADFNLDESVAIGDTSAIQFRMAGIR